MQTLRIINQRTGIIIGDKVGKADTFWYRLRGLMGRQRLDAGEGLWLNPCRQVHTHGMKFPLSVWFLDRKGEICEIIDCLEPGKISLKVKEAHSVLEFPADWAQYTSTKKGDQLVWE